MYLYISIHVDPVDGFAWQQLCVFQFPYDHVQVTHFFLLEWCWYYYPLTCHGDSINYHHFISEWPVWFFLYFSCHWWPAMQYIFKGMLRCSSFIFTGLISSAAMQSGMSMHDSMALLSCLFSICLVILWVQTIHYKQMSSRFVQYYYYIILVDA